MLLARILRGILRGNIKRASATNACVSGAGAGTMPPAACLVSSDPQLEPVTLTPPHAYDTQH